MSSVSRRLFNILVIDNCVYPLTYGYMQEIFGKCLPERGHQVSWLLMSSDAQSKGESRNSGLTNALLTPMMDRKNRYSKSLNYFYFKPMMASILSKIITRRKIDVVFVRNHVRVGFLTYRSCQKNNIPFVYYLGYPALESHLFAARLGHKKPRILAEVSAFIGLPLQKWITRRADFVFTMSDYWANKVINELEIASGKVMSLPAGFDASIEPESVDGTKIRKQFHLTDNPTMFYMGTISPPRDMNLLIDMVKKVAARLPEVKLLLLYGFGEENRVPGLRQKFAERGIENNVIFAPPVPYQQVPNYIAASHIGLSPIETIPIYNVSSPYKFTEMLGMGCPVVASDTPEQKSILEKTGAGICVPYNADAFAEGAVYLLTHPDKARQMGRQGREFVLKERSYDILANRVEKVFENLITDR